MSKLLEHTQNQFVIRFPEDIAAKLNDFFDGKTDIPPELKIIPFVEAIKPNQQQISFKINIDGIQKKGTLIQLPTITETFKTIDRVNFFKSNDISQMILVHDDNKIGVTQKQAKKVVQNSGMVRYKSHSGITPPTKYIKQRFFRKKPKIDIHEVEKVEAELHKIRQDLPYLTKGPDIELSQSKKKRKSQKRLHQSL